MCMKMLANPFDKSMSKRSKWTTSLVTTSSLIINFMNHMWLGYRIMQTITFYQCFSHNLGSLTITKFMDIGNFLIEVEEIIICMKEFPHVLQMFFPFSISSEFWNQLLHSIQIQIHQFIDLVTSLFPNNWHFEKNYLLIWASCCSTLPMTFYLFFSYHVPIWFSTSHYYLYQFQI
jgi:hypothetical protein